MARQALIATALIALAGPVAAMDFAVDRSAEWYDPEASHHGKHAVGGAAFGAVVFAGSYAVTDSRPASYVLAIAGTATLATFYEGWHARDGSALMDPVDIAWTTAGGIVGAILADLGIRGVSAMIRDDSVAVGYRVTF